MIKDQKFYDRLGFALKSQRRLKKIKAQEIGDKLKVSAQQIHKYETGKDRIPVDKLTIYCKVLKIKPEWVIGWANGKSI